ncbi:hypothetical protein PRVXH_000619 [Proteinivorax hydrogeniformans]|uniref:Uncharacterized protein n=1 Tax=Proteinivorax hydrogeniformans TaxID=1826727 RepID=A0AAU8HV80_9FIRM
MFIKNEASQLLFNKFKEKFPYDIKSLSSEIYPNLKENIVEFKSTLILSNGLRKVSVLLNKEFDVVEVSYLGYPLKFKEHNAFFYNNEVKVISVKLPVNPKLLDKIKLTFKYYSTPNPWVSIKKDGFFVNANGYVFPQKPTDNNHPSKVSLASKKGLKLMCGGSITKDGFKADKQVVHFESKSCYGLSVIGNNSLKSLDNYRNYNITILYPRKYLNQARKINAITKSLLEKWDSYLPYPLDKKINIILSDGNFTPFSDGVNTVLPTWLIDEIKEKGGTPKEREEILFKSLAPKIVKVWFKSIQVPPSQKWFVESICDFAALHSFNWKYNENNIFKEPAWANKHYDQLTTDEKTKLGSYYIQLAINRSGKSVEEFLRDLINKRNVNMESIAKPFFQGSSWNVNRLKKLTAKILPNKNTSRF